MLAFSLVEMACSKGAVDSPASLAEPETADTGALQKADVDSDPPMREAFGLPLPPEVMSVVSGPHAVTVKTPLDLDELENFFKSRLVDFEILRPRAKIQIIGLHEGSPQINGIFFWARNGGYTQLEYRAGRPEIKDTDTTQKQAGQNVARTRHQPRKRVAGTAVTEKTPDGVDLAPDARYGKPYTPPKGSPLHRQDNRANFGKPYGEWIPH
jgi:hypothetical protein